MRLPSEYVLSIRRLANILFKVGTILSLVMSMFVAGLWIRSYWAIDLYGHESSGVVILAKGTLFIGRLPAPPRGSGKEFHAAWPYLPSAEISDERPVIRVGDAMETIFSLDKHRLAGFGFGSGSGQLIQYTNVYWMAYLPHWFLMLILLILPVTKFAFVARRRQWKRIGRCVGCGYDLRATLERCPECGRANEEKGRETQPTTADAPAA